MNRIIFHRADLDGIGSCMVVLKYLFIIGVPKEDIMLIPWDYGDPVPTYETTDRIIIVDISMPPDWMSNLYNRFKFSYNDVIWIDHHKTSYNDSVKHEYDNLPGFRVLHRPSAVELCWKYFFCNEPAPRGIELLSMYDTWDNEDKSRWDDVVCPFQMGMLNDWLSQMITASSGESLSRVVDRFFENIYNIGKVIEKGEAVRDYLEFANAKASQRAFSFRWKGVTFAALNHEGNSNCFVPRVIGFLYTACMMFKFDSSNLKWRFSLYGVDSNGQKPDIDLSVLAKSMGGGGHAGACGFEVRDLREVFGETLSVDEFEPNHLA